MRKSLSLGGEPDYIIDSFAKTSGFLNPIKLIRLRSPEFGLPTVEVNGIPHLTMKDDGLIDKNGFIHVKIRPDTPRPLLHYYLDGILNSLSIKDPRKKGRFRGEEKLLSLEVYGLRILEKSYPEIARKMKLTKKKQCPVCVEGIHTKLNCPKKGFVFIPNVDAVRKMYLTAHKFIEGTEYDPSVEKPEIRTRHLQRNCETCTNQTCTKPPYKECDDVSPFVNQHVAEDLL